MLWVDTNLHSFFLTTPELLVSAMNYGSQSTVGFSKRSDCSGQREMLSEKSGTVLNNDATSGPKV